MNDQSAAGASGVSQDISHQGAALVNETTHWISGNLPGIAISAAIGVVIALLLYGIRSLGYRILTREPSAGVHWQTIFGRVLSKTSVFFIIFCAAELVAEHANTPPMLLRAIHFLFVISFAFQAAIWARELVLGYVEHRVGPEAEHSTLGSAIGIIRLLVSIALFAIALILTLDNLGVNVTGLVAGLGIGGIAIGLAAQGIFADLFAALAIIFDKPFRRGDTIQFDKTTGTVERIGLKTTRIRSATGEEVVVSNTNLLGKELHNFANLKRRRQVLTFTIPAQTPPETIGQIPDKLRAIVERHKNSSVIRCGITGFAADAKLELELTFDIAGKDSLYAFDTRSQISLEILEALKELNIQMA